MSQRCPDCHQFAGDDHECPDWFEPDEGRICELDGCEEELGKDQSSYCSWDHYVEAQDAEAPASSVEIEEDLLDYAVVRDPETGDPARYHFVVDGQIYPIPADTWDSICADYSEMGGDLTQKQVAREYGISYPVLKRILRKAGQYKASLPMSRETIADASQDELVEKSLEAKEKRVVRKLQQEEVRELRRRVKQLEKEDYKRRKLAKAAARIAGEIEVPEPGLIDLADGTGETFEAHVPTTDEHVGKLVRGKETFGDNYDTDIATDRIRAHGDRAVRRIAEWPGRCTVAHRSFLGDVLHAILGETEHGTSLDQDTRSFRVWQHTVEAAVYGITSLLQVAETVKVRGVEGNHEGFLFYIFLDAIRRTFADHDRVDVELTPRKFDAFRVGDSLHVLDHGYGLNKLTTASGQVSMNTVARETGGEDFHGAKWIYTWLGDKHEYQTALVGRHHELIRLDSLGESDDYETSLRYASRPVGYVYRLKDDGRIADESRLYFTSDAA